MGTADRRRDIMKSLCRRRFETVKNLAFEFGVSERTIQRDIEELSLSEPIYTRCGRYGGGVYVVDGYSMNRVYMSDTEMHVLKKLYALADNNTSLLTYQERVILGSIIRQYSKPTLKIERN